MLLPGGTCLRDFLETPVAPEKAEEIIILLPSADEETLSELRGTTETKSQTGYVQYHPSERNVEHVTDSLRAAILAILSLSEISEKGVVVDELGWITGTEGSNWTPPWA